MTTSWYVLHSKANKEELCLCQLTARLVDVYYPCVHVRPVNPRSRRIQPYFPGYLFIHIDLESFDSSILRWLPGSRGLVTFDNTIPSVPDAFIDNIRQKVHAANQSVKKPLAGINQGDPVQITDGPFAGQTAIFDKCKNGRDRVQVLIYYLRNRKIPVELSVNQMMRMKAEPKSL